MIRKYLLSIVILFTSCTKIEFNLDNTKWQQSTTSNFEEFSVYSITTIVFKDEYCGYRETIVNFTSSLEVYSKTYRNDFYYFYNDDIKRGELYILDNLFNEIERIKFGILSNKLWTINFKNHYERI